jgi:hypothetical protein
MTVPAHMRAGLDLQRTRDLALEMAADHEREQREATGG